MATTVESAAGETRGLRVDGRCWSVDFFETALTLGQLPRMLRTCLDAARLGPNERLLDIGCGSGRLVIAAARQIGAASGGGEAIGIDATPGMIELARRAAARAGVDVQFKVGVAERLPLPDASVDAVTSSFFFHHLPAEVKRDALDEMWRVLKPGGRLIVADYGRPRGLLGYVASFPMRFNFYEYVRPQLRGELDDLVRTRLDAPAETVRRFLGYIQVIRIVKPPAA